MSISTTTLRSQLHCVFNLKRHLVLVSAYRREVITSAIMDDLEIHIRRVCEMSDVGVLEFSGETDHVHILLALHPSVMPAKLVNSIKTLTSRRIRKDHWETIKTQLWGERFWSRSYCVLSVDDGANTEIIKRYIQNQTWPS
ncbi:IS200/IS605 family transposase [Vreelandella rituensis]|uniref:IS200/IS605 family transposase n=1 Tax=Vreelandella rituensis TaxID=2282306 RepID=UPI0015F0AFAD|nr:IS200/IS605 family transposase [Halomonas rituensis]